jgi:Protein of unknown function (DUF1566)
MKHLGFVFGLLIVLVCISCGDSTGDETEDTGADSGSDTDSDSDSDTGEMTECADGSGLFDPNTQLCWQDVMPPESSYDWGDVAGQDTGYCDKLSFGGHPDWRIPTIDELRSLIRGCPDTETGGSCAVTEEVGLEGFNGSCKGCARFKGPGVGGNYWDPALDGYDDQRCWGSTWSFPTYGKMVLFVDFTNGKVGTELRSDDGSDEEGEYWYEFDIRCVRSDIDTDTGPPAPAPDCDGGKLDENTGLCWMDPAAALRYDWQGAIDYCDELDLEGHADWYLPSKQELIDLLEGGCDEGVLTGTGGWCNNCRDSESCRTMFGPDFSAFISLIWTSEPKDDDNAWRGDIVGGNIGISPKDQDKSVRCVRVE